MEKKNGARGNRKSFRWDGGVTEQDVKNVGRLIKENDVRIVD